MNCGSRKKQRKYSKKYLMHIENSDIKSFFCYNITEVNFETSSKFESLAFSRRFRVGFRYILFVVASVMCEQARPRPSAS
jgi:hypothetical protein